MLIALKETGNLETGFAVALHTHVQALKPEVEQICVMRALNAAEVAHELRRRLGDECAADAEALGVGHAVIALVRGAKAGEFVGVLCPVKFARVYYRAADRSAVAVHILGGRVRHDIRTPFKRAAVDGRRKGVVYDERHAVAVSNFCEFLNVEHLDGGVCDGLAEYELGIRPERRLKLLLGAVGRDKGEVNAHFFHCDRKEIVCAAVYRGGGYHMVAAGGKVEYGKEIRRLTR